MPETEKPSKESMAGEVLEDPTLTPMNLQAALVGFNG